MYPDVYVLAGGAESLPFLFEGQPGEGASPLVASAHWRQRPDEDEALVARPDERLERAVSVRPDVTQDGPVPINLHGFG